VFRIRTRIRRIRMFLGLTDPHPDPLERGTVPTDPRILIRNKCHGSPTLLKSWSLNLFFKGIRRQLLFVIKFMFHKEKITLICEKILQIGPCSTWEKVVSNFGPPQPPPPDMLGAAGALQALHHQQEQRDPRTTASITLAPAAAVFWTTRSYLRDCIFASPRHFVQ
jgi:hypothetical protein